jgi:hypothetical protein
VCCALHRQGIVAFNDYYTQSDLCAANTMLAHEDYWLNSVDSIVEYDGPDFDGTADQSESDLGKSLLRCIYLLHVFKCCLCCVCSICS